MTRAAKGPKFERWLCEQLSRWWTNGERTDVFWRTSSSGGRATTRSKSGQKTKGQYGDICATDPIGQPLLDLLTIEVKRGYNKYTIADLLDRPEGAAKQKYEQWITKAIHDHEQAGSFSWMLIVKRDRRQPIVLLPAYLFKDLEGIQESWHMTILLGLDWLELSACQLEDFLQAVSPEVIRRDLHRWNSRPCDRDEA